MKPGGSCASCSASSGASSVLLSLRSGLPSPPLSFTVVSLSPSCSEVSSWERAASIRSGAGGDLVDRLVADRDAYVIAEVRAYAARQATMARRHSFATAIRSTVQETAPSRISAAAQELEALAQELDDENLELDPACAVACMRLLEDPADSSLLDAVAPREELQWRISRIRSPASAPPASRKAPRRRYARMGRRDPDAQRARPDDELEGRAQLDSLSVDAGVDG